MNKLLLSAFIALVVLLSGCATSMQVHTEHKPIAGEKFKYQIITMAEITEEALGILRARLDDQLSGSGNLANNADGSATQVAIAITSYRMRHGATRALVGIFAGTDNMVSTVTIKDPKTSAVKAQFEVGSRNSTAWGTSRGMIEDHADQIAKYLTTGSTN